VFLGTHVNGLDAKGRASVPADFRAIVRAEGLEGVYCWPSPDDACLVGCGAALMGRYKALADNMDLFDPLRDVLAHSVFAGVRTLNFDANGRITLPDTFVAHAGLDGQSTFVGLADRFEIWRPQACQDHQAEAHARFRASRSDSFGGDVQKAPAGGRAGGEGGGA